MSLAILLGQLTASTTPVRSRSGGGQAGRPINPNSRRQRILAWLDEQDEPVTTEQISAGLDVPADDRLTVTLCELAREGQVERAGRTDGKRNLWRAV